MSGTQDATSTQPPSSYELPDVQSWFAKAADGVRVLRMEAFRNQAHRLENLEIHLEIDTASHRVTPTDGFQKRLADLTGSDRFEEHFELPAVAEYAARALTKGGYRGFVHVETDGDTVYNKEEHGKDLQMTVQLVTEASHRNTRCQDVRLDAVDDDFGDTRARLEIRKDRKRQRHTIDLTFRGEVPEENFQQILVHLRDQFDRVYTSAQ